MKAVATNRAMATEQDRAQIYDAPRRLCLAQSSVLRAEHTFFGGC